MLSEYYGFPLPFIPPAAPYSSSSSSSSSGAGTIGQIVADVPSGLSGLTSPQVDEKSL
jgi:hypothetical protein